MPGDSLCGSRLCHSIRKVAHMSQAIVNPTDLRRFAQQLKHFNGELTANLNALQRQMVSLASSCAIRSIRNSLKSSSNR